jgi:hypothetical protein
LVAAEAPATAPSGDAARDWALIEGSGDPRDVRNFRDLHPTGILVRKAADRLADLADAEWTAVRGSQRTRIEHFVKLFR